MWKKLSLLVLASLFLFACRGRTVAPQPVPPKIIAGPAVLEQIGRLWGPGGIPAPVDLLTAQPVSGAVVRADLLGRWARLVIDAPGYVRKYKWLDLTSPAPEQVLLAPKDPDRYDSVAWKNENAPRLIMLGFDGMTESWFRAALDRQELPAFATLLRRGAWGPLKSCCGPISPAVWTTIYTGLTPEQHGIADFLGHDPVTGDPVTLTYNDIRAPRLWEILRGAGRKTLVFGGLLLDPSLNVFGNASDFARRVKIFRRAIAAERPQLAVLYEEEADHVSHEYWSATDPVKFRAHGWPVTDEEANFFGQRIPQAYRNLDGWVAAALQAAGPDTVILINSDHGFQDAADTPPVEVHSDSFVRVAAPAGYRACDTDDISELIICADPGVNPQAFVRQLRAARLGNGEAAFARVTDRTQPGFPTNESQAVAIRVTPNGRALYEALGRGEQIVLGGRKIPLGSFLRVNPSSGEHSQVGVLFLAGRGVKPESTIADADVFDLMPTALAILGLPVGRDMSGHVLLDVFSSPPRVTSVETYGRLKPGGPRPRATAEELKRLRDLGYIN